MRSSFIGRSRELKEFKRLHQSQKAEFLILYGRRRIGKTRLITQWMEMKDHAPLFCCGAYSSVEQLRSFSQAILRFESPQSQPPQDMSYGDWRTAFEALARLAEKERLAVIIDEFTYLLEAEPAVSAYMQHAWDHTLSKSNLFLIISGSHRNDAAPGFVLSGATIWSFHRQSALAAIAVWRH